MWEIDLFKPNTIFVKDRYVIKLELLSHFIANIQLDVRRSLYSIFPIAKSSRISSHSVARVLSEWEPGVIINRGVGPRLFAHRYIHLRAIDFSAR